MSGYREVIIEGPEGWGPGFLEGYLRGRGEIRPVLDAEEEGFACAPAVERLRELIQPSREVSHLLVPDEALDLVHRAAAEAADEGHAVEIREERPLAGARFEFRTTVYSPEHGRRIREMLEHPPEGARLSPESRFEETRRPDVEGLDSFAPDHAYTLEGKGAIEGSVPAVVDLYRRCRDEELIRVEPAHLVPA